MTNDELLDADPSESGTSKPRAFETILYGGLAIGVLDFLDATIFFMTYAGVGFARIWQSVAAGLLGREAAVAGGWSTATFGIFLHFVIAFIIATIYFVGARSIPFLIKHPIVSGLAYGVVCNFVMQYIVIPLSAAGGGPPQPFQLAVFLNSVIGHAFLVGLPVALFAAWSAKKN